MAIIQTTVFEDASGRFSISLSEDTILHQWTTVTVVNGASRPLTVSGQFNSIPFSVTVPTGSGSYVFNAPIQLVQFINPRTGFVGWGPSVTFAIGVSSRSDT